MKGSGIGAMWLSSLALAGLAVSLPGCAVAAAQERQADASAWMNELGWRQMGWCSARWIDARDGGSWRQSRLMAFYLRCLEYNGTGSQMIIAGATLASANAFVPYGATSGERQCLALWDLWELAWNRLDEDGQDALTDRLTEDGTRTPREADCD